LCDPGQKASIILIILDSCKLQVGGMSKVQNLLQWAIKIAVHFNKEKEFFWGYTPQLFSRTN
jgi:hypothetical protein